MLGVVLCVVLGVILDVVVDWVVVLVVVVVVVRVVVVGWQHAAEQYAFISDGFISHCPDSAQMSHVPPGYSAVLVHSVRRKCKARLF